MTDREAMQMALKALESGLAFSTHSPVLQNLRAALEQQAEPVANQFNAGIEACMSRLHEMHRIASGRHNYYGHAALELAKLKGEV